MGTQRSKRVSDVSATTPSLFIHLILGIIGGTLGVVACFFWSYSFLVFFACALVYVHRGEKQNVVLENRVVTREIVVGKQVVEEEDRRPRPAWVAKDSMKKVDDIWNLF